uniref:Uncharacterized protein n=1 Tax=Aegilops tauschii subsp. strangulata TaxID=200361 RepID=A0A453SA96_AEGTS
LAAGRPRLEREGAAIATSPPWPPPPRSGSPHQPTTPPRGRVRGGCPSTPSPSAPAAPQSPLPPPPPPRSSRRHRATATTPTGPPVCPCPSPSPATPGITLPRPLTSTDLMGQARGKASGSLTRGARAPRICRSSLLLLSAPLMEIGQ